MHNNSAFRSGRQAAPRTIADTINKPFSTSARFDTRPPDVFLIRSTVLLRQVYLSLNNNCTQESFYTIPYDTHHFFLVVGTTHVALVPELLIEVRRKGQNLLELARDPSSSTKTASFCQPFVQCCMCPISLMCPTIFP